MNHENPAAAIYWMYAEDGELLYVGCTVDLPRRLREHMTGNGHWLEEVVRIELEWHPDTKSERAAESKAIAAEDPRYNISGTPRQNTWYRYPTRKHELVEGWHYLKREEPTSGTS